MLSLTQEAAYSFPKEQRMSKYTLRQYLVPLVLVILSLAILIIGLVTVLQEGNPATPTPAGQIPPSDLTLWQNEQDSTRRMNSQQQIHKACPSAG